MTEQNPELEQDREAETVEVKDIYEDVPEFDEAPWANAIIEGVQDDEAEEA